MKGASLFSFQFKYKICEDSSVCDYEIEFGIYSIFRYIVLYLQ